MSPPALPFKRWVPGEGRYPRTDHPRIVAEAGAPWLVELARVTAEDLSASAGGPVEWVVGRPARAGDVVLANGSAGDVGDSGDEGYTVTIGSWITIGAATATGVFRGTRTVLPLLRRRDLPGGTGWDWPRTRLRGLMVDVGRKHFTLGWLRDRIRELADLNMNCLHLHLSDDLGFRVESETCPQAVSAEHYTKDELRQVVEFARRRHVTVLPEIDMPGHMGALLTGRRHLRLTNSHGVTAANLAEAESYALTEDLLAEYLPLFDGPYWHLGADEYVIDGAYPELAEAARNRYGADATPKDLFYGFVNWAAGLVRQAGRRPVVWNDEIKTDDGTVPLDETLTVDYWSNRGPTPAALAAAGHELINSSFAALYYVLGDLRPRQDGWHAGVFDGGHVLPADLDHRRLGAKLHVWCDDPAAETEEQVAEGIAAALRVTARNTW